MDTNGNVGIGTDTPQAKLHVKNGFLLFDTGFGGSEVHYTYGDRSYKYTFEGNGYNMLLKAKDNCSILGADRINGTVDNPQPLANDDDIFSIRAAGTNANGTQTYHNLLHAKVDGDPNGDILNQKLYLLDGGIVIRSSGNVGIGTADPSEKLTIKNGGIKLHNSQGIGFIGDTPYDCNVSGDRARFYYNTSFIGDNVDYLVFEKTDGNNVDPDGGIVFANKGVDNISEVALLILGNGNVGIGTTTPQYKLDVNGPIRGDNFAPSDIRWKENIESLENALNIVTQLRGVSCEWIDPSRGEGRQIGVIAQEVEQVLPGVVHTDSQGYKSVEYAKIVTPSY